MTATYSAHGKVILLGEHAVVYGFPALAAAIDRGLHCDVRSCREKHLALSVPEWNLVTSSDESNPVAQAMRAIAAAAQAPAMHKAIHVRAEFPARAGLGSSAALCVAIARALAPHNDNTATETIATAGERCFHGAPSGVDVALAVRGGMGLFAKEKPYQPLFCRPFSLVVGLSAQLRSTATMVEKVAEATQKQADARDHLAALGASAVRGAKAVVENDLHSLAAEMDLSQEHLAALGLSTPVIDGMLATAKKAGAWGAKLTGAGGGGAVIALAPGQEERVAESWRGEGYQAFVVGLGPEQHNTSAGAAIDV